MYHHPYSEEVDRVSLPPQYKVSDFMKFSGSKNISMIEHNDNFLTQCEEALVEPLLVRLFSLSLYGSAFVCFASL
jgi:hypothetical protein